MLKINAKLNRELNEYILEVKGLELQSISKAPSKIFSYLVNNSGKHVRSILFYLIMKSINSRITPPRSLAASFELLHTASLCHDDVVDESKLRRGKKTLTQQFSSKFSILAGDLLLCSAVDLAKETKSWEVMDLFSDLGKKLTSGVLMENSLKINDKYNVYYNQIYLKTASFFETISKIAAILLNQPLKQYNLLKNFGIHFGKIFQINDDYEDYFCSSEITGKRQGTDFFNHVVTLPLMILYNLDVKNRENIVYCFNNPSQDNFMKILELMIESDVRNFIIKELQHLICESIGLLSFIPNSSYKNELIKLFNMSELVDNKKLCYKSNRREVYND